MVGQSSTLVNVTKMPLCCILWTHQLTMKGQTNWAQTEITYMNAVRNLNSMLRL